MLPELEKSSTDRQARTRSNPWTKDSHVLMNQRITLRRQQSNFGGRNFQGHVNTSAELFIFHVHYGTRLWIMRHSAVWPLIKGPGRKCTGSRSRLHRILLSSWFPLWAWRFSQFSPSLSCRHMFAHYSWFDLSQKNEKIRETACLGNLSRTERQDCRPKCQMCCFSESSY